MPSDPVPVAEPKLSDVVLAVAAQLDPDRMGTGSLASLRRLDPNGALAEPALQRLLWRHVPEGWLHGEGLRRWALLIHAMSLAAPALHRTYDNKGWLGLALFEAGFSEGRLIRLLESRAEDLPVAVPRAIRFLVAKQQSFSSIALAFWLFGIAAGGERAEKQRTEVARQYYRAERDASKAA